MTWQMYGNEKFDEGIEIGRAEGKAEGKEEGLKETAIRMFSKGIDVKMIAEMVGETEEKVKEWVQIKEV